MDVDPKQLLSLRTLTIASRGTDPEIARVHSRMKHAVVVDGRGDLEELFGRLLVVGDRKGPRVTRTIDFVGHTTAEQQLVQLGDWLLDGSRSSVTAFFRELADHEVLQRLGIVALRLIGSGTARTPAGITTLHTLSRILSLEVFGTQSVMHAAYFDAEGYRHDMRHLLTSATDLREVSDESYQPVYGSSPRGLDLDALPALPLHAPAEMPIPLRVVPEAMARDLLQLISRHDPFALPGLLSMPSVELALPSSRPGLYHRLQVVLGTMFVRSYPDAKGPSVMYPIVEPAALRSMIDKMPIVAR
jgi:hypothetical protein